MEEEFHQHFNGLRFFSVLNVLWFVELKCGTHLQKVCHQLKQETTPASSECSRVNNSHQWMNCGQKKHSASVTARWLDSRKHYISPKRKGQQMRHTFEVFLSWTLKILILLSIQVCCCLKKHQAQAWALTISIAAVLYVANVLLYHANGRNALCTLQSLMMSFWPRDHHLLCNASATNLARLFPLLWEQWKLCILWGRRGDSQSNNTVWA
jgi:hypothetical protein